MQEAMEIEAARDYQSSSDEHRHQTFAEGKRYAREVKYFTRNAKLAKRAKQKARYICQACGFDPVRLYGTAGENCVECHHVSPFSERGTHYAV